MDIDLSHINGADIARVLLDLSLLPLSFGSNNSNPELLPQCYINFILIHYLIISDILVTPAIPAGASAAPYKGLPEEIVREYPRFQSDSISNRFNIARAFRLGNLSGLTQQNNYARSQRQWR